MAVKLTKKLKQEEIDISVSLYGHLQIMLLLNNNEQSEYIKGFGHCLDLLVKWTDEREKLKQINK